MNNLNTTTNLVKQVLETVPASRNSDNLLFIEVAKVINYSVITKPLVEVMTNLKAYNLPSIETVGRCRRKLQAEFPDLRPIKAVADFRGNLEAEFREWAKGSD